jgi:acetyl esterase
MRLEPQSQAFLDAFKAEERPPRETIPIPLLREQFETLAYESPAPIRDVKTLEIPGPHHNIRLRLYFPKKQGSLPVFVTFHGGGWVVGSLNVHDAFCREVCSQAETLVVSVDYGLAPENKFPKPLEDCYAATLWASKHIHEYGGDSNRLSVGGDSAGGNLATAVCLLAAERHGPKIAAQVLLYPVTNCQFDTPSYTQFGEGYFLEKETMKLMWSLYLPSPAEGKNPHASPLQANVKGLPPALFILASCDLLHDEGLAYSKHLKAAGVPTAVYAYDTIHGFVTFANQLEVGQQALREIARFIKKF